MKPHLHTFLQHAGQADFDDKTGAAPVAMPPVRTSTVRFKTLSHLDQAIAARQAGERAVIYGRGGMDTHRALEDVFCELEGGTQAFLVPSGMAAISLAMLSFLSQGDHVVVADCAYAPVRTLDKNVLERMGVNVSYCAPTPQACQAAIQSNTKVLYVESPGSLLMQMLDMPALAAVAQAHDLILMTDNTWGSGLIYQPLALGADVSIIAGTKYIGGHSDLMLGAVVAKNSAHAQQIEACHYALGFSVSADDVWLALRGVRTLPLRMQQSAASALQVCEFLASWPEVSAIYHPAWPHDPQHALWQRDAFGSNGLLAFSLRVDMQAARRFVDALRLFGIGFSWGGFESLVQLVEPAALANHSYWNPENGFLIRLHIGLEQVEDLVADLAQARQQLESI